MKALVLEERYLVGETILGLLRMSKSIGSIARVPDATLVEHFCYPDFPDLVFADLMMFSELARENAPLVDAMKKSCGIAVYSVIETDQYRNIALDKGADVFIKIGEMTIMTDLIVNRIIKAMVAKRIKIEGFAVGMGESF